MSGCEHEPPPGHALGPGVDRRHGLAVGAPQVDRRDLDLVDSAFAQRSHGRET